MKKEDKFMSYLLGGGIVGGIFGGFVGMIGVIFIMALLALMYFE